jgi:hypothetical protein
VNPFKAIDLIDQFSVGRKQGDPAFLIVDRGNRLLKGWIRYDKRKPRTDVLSPLLHDVYQVLNAAFNVIVGAEKIRISFQPELAHFFLALAIELFCPDLDLLPEFDDRHDDGDCSAKNCTSQAKYCGFHNVTSQGSSVSAGKAEKHKPPSRL